MNVNWLAVLVSAVASLVIGGIWFGPMFGKMYMSAMGMDKMSQEQKDAMKKNMTMTYVWQFIASLLMFYVLAGFIAWYPGMMSAKGGMTIALWAWLGFVVPLKFGDAIWGGKMSLFWLAIGNSLITLLVGGAIIGAWK
jgi:uncharacterized membrane protein